MLLMDLPLTAANALERIGYLFRMEDQAGGLHPAQWAALRFLDRANRFSRKPIALTRYLGSTRGTVSQTINALERKGLVARAPSKSDARSVDLSITKAGRELLRSDPLSALAGEISLALGEDIGSFGKMLERVLSQLIMSNSGRAFGQCKACRFFEANGGSTTDEPHHCGLLNTGLSDEDSEHICTEFEKLEEV